MTTLQEELSLLNNENAELRDGIQKLHNENLMLRGYQRVFQNLHSFVSPELWERLQVQLHMENCQACQESMPQQIPPQQIQTQQPTMMQEGCHPVTALEIFPPNRAPPPSNSITHVGPSFPPPGHFCQSPRSWVPPLEPLNNLHSERTLSEVPPMPDLCANLLHSMQHEEF